jgi:hypothetical protein|tara:strand:- start:768 stop:1007 length:240 start_codon:yes stop_codon:yes gene_type:complete
MAGQVMADLFDDQERLDAFEAGRRIGVALGFLDSILRAVDEDALDAMSASDNLRRDVRRARAYVRELDAELGAAGGAKG